MKPAPGTPPQSRRGLFLALGCLGLAGVCGVGTLALGLLGASDESPQAPATQAEPGAARNTVTVAELVGEWRVGAGSSVDFVNSGGVYTRSSTVVSGEVFSLRDDNTYESQFHGMANSVAAHSAASGTWALTGDKLLFTTDEGTTTGYYFISFQPLTNGAAVLTLMPDRYEPNPANFGFWKEKWGRAAE